MITTSQVEDLEGERARIGAGLRHVEQVPAAFGHEAGADLAMEEKTLMWNSLFRHMKTIQSVILVTGANPELIFD